MIDEFPKLPLAPGDYPAEWYIGGRTICGHIHLEPMRPAQAQLFDDIEEPDPERTFWVSTETEMPRLVGSLRSGQDVVLTDVDLTLWFPRRSVGMARHAVVGIGIAEVEGDAYERIRLQITGGDLLFGVAPIRATYWPKDQNAHLDGKFSAEGNPESTHEWTDHESGVSIRCSYDYSFAFGDAYRPEVRFAPVITMTSRTVLTVDEWVNTWVMPLLRVASLATRKPQRLAWLTVHAGDPGLDDATERMHLPSGIVFGGGIAQAPYQAENPTEFRERETRPLFTLGSLQTPLQDLLVRWLAMESDKNPFVELYTLAMVNDDLPVRARYLYLLQALEALHGYENRTQDQRSQADYARKREAALEDLAVVADLDALADHPARDRLLTATRFVKRKLSKRMPDSLERRLAALIKELPQSVRDDLHTPEMGTIQADLIADGQTTLQDQFRVLRNWLSHGVKNYPARDLQPWVRAAETLCRAHALRLLGFDEAAISDGLAPPTGHRQVAVGSAEDDSASEANDTGGGAGLSAAD